MNREATCRCTVRTKRSSAIGSTDYGRLERTGMERRMARAMSTRRTYRDIAHDRQVLTETGYTFSTDGNHSRREGFILSFPKVVGIHTPSPVRQS